MMPPKAASMTTDLIKKAHQRKVLGQQVQHDEVSDKIACEKFVYSGDQNTIGTRWTTWNEQFDLYVTVNGLTDGPKIKASY